MNKNEESTAIVNQYTKEMRALYDKYLPLVRRLQDSPYQRTAKQLKATIFKLDDEYGKKRKQLDPPDKGKGRRIYESAIGEFRLANNALTSLGTSIHIREEGTRYPEHNHREEFYPLDKPRNREEARTIDKDTYRKLSQLARLHKHFINVRNETTIWALEKDVSFIVMDGDANHINVNVFLNEIRSYKLDRATEEHTNTTYTPKKTMVFTLPKTNLIGAVLYYGIKIRNFWGGAECWERENHQAFCDLT